MEVGELDKSEPCRLWRPQEVIWILFKVNSLAIGFL
jgi:hypothetical protein